MPDAPICGSLIVVRTSHRQPWSQTAVINGVCSPKLQVSAPPVFSADISLLVFKYWLSQWAFVPVVSTGHWIPELHEVSWAEGGGWVQSQNSKANVACCGRTEAKGPCYSLPECISMPARACTLMGTSHRGEGFFAVCVSIRQGERNSRPPHRIPSTNQAVCSPQPTEERGGGQL